MSLPDHNPFQAPIQSSVKEELPIENANSLDFIVIAKKWERYRLIYNAILIVETVGLALLLFGLTPPISLIAFAIFGAVIVNFFFMLGVVLDGYCQWHFKSQHSVFGLIIFVLGTLFTALMVALTVLGSIGI